MKKILEKFTLIWYYINGKVYKGGMYEMMDIISLCNYVIKSFNEKDSKITNLKLQKVLYYIQGYFLKQFNSPAFSEELYCWTYGPVVPLAYYEFNVNGANPLQHNACVNINIREEHKKLIDTIILRCKDIPSSALVEKTHQEAPWKNAYRGDIISKQAIERYFFRNDPLEICNT